MNRPILSVVVPTKNRYQYLYHLIKLVASYNFVDFELVIQDNSDDNSEFLSNIKIEDYPFIKYFYQSEPVSQSRNSDLSILNSTGEYVCFIGDDDGVTRFAIDAARWMKENNVAILKSSPFNYKWPSFISTQYYNVSSSALFNKFTMTYRIVDNKVVLAKLLKTGIDTLNYMPKVYNGIAKRSTLDRIYEKCGSFFPGPSPDMANAVSLALEEANYAYVDAPIIIGGHSGHVGGNVNRYKKHYGPLEEQPFIDKKYIDEWSQEIPKIWCANTVWPESAITALKAYDAVSLLSQIDYIEVHKKFIVENPSISDMAYNISSNPSLLKKKVFYYKLIRKFKGLRNVLKYKLFGVYDGMKLYRNVEDIVTAEDLACKGIVDFKLKKA